MMKKHLLALTLVCLLLFSAACGAPVETTKVPETTMTPETTKAPETTKLPETTEAPETTKTPETTEEPETEKAPESEEEIPMTVQPADIVKIPNGAKAIITLTHDDGHLATGQFMSEQFGKYDLRGTFGFITKNFANAEGRVWQGNVSPWLPILATGRFEVASHSFTHNFVGKSDAGDTGLTLYSNVNKSQVTEENATIPAGNLTKEIITSAELLETCFPNQRVLTYIKAGTPGYKDEEGNFVQLSPEAMEMVKGQYIAMRNTTGGLSGAALVEDIDTVDLYGVHSLQVSASQTGESWMTYVDHALEKGGWMTYLFHRILEDDEASGIHAKKSEAEKLFAYVGQKVASGEAVCMTFSEAARYIAEYRSASGEVRTYSDRLEIELTDELSDLLYDQPLSVKVNVPSTWQSVCMTYADGRTEIRNTQNGFIYVDVVPDAGFVTLKAE